MERENIKSRKLADESLIIIGRILREWGLKGELMVLPLTFDPERFLSLREVMIQFQDVIEKKRVKYVKPYKNHLLLSFDDCKVPEDARKYRGALIKIDKSESPELPEGVYYHYQIIGLMVYTLDGTRLGQINAILEIKNNDVYVVKENDKECLIPAIKDVIREINLESNKMIVDVAGIVDC